jgi:hypothetical protein
MGKYHLNLGPAFEEDHSQLRVICHGISLSVKSFWLGDEDRRLTAETIVVTHDTMQEGRILKSLGKRNETFVYYGASPQRHQELE